MDSGPRRLFLIHLLTLLLAPSPAQWDNETEAAVGNPDADLLCNRGKYFTCICQRQSGEFSELYPGCGELLGRGGGRSRVLVLQLRPRHGDDVCIRHQNWLELRWEFRNFIAERLNNHCLPHPQDCQGAVLNIRADSVVLLKVECNRLELVVLKQLRFTVLNHTAIFDPAQLLAILEPWTTLFRLMFHKDNAFLALKEYRYPQAVKQLGDAMVSDHLFHFLYAASAFLLCVVLIVLLVALRTRNTHRTP